MLRLLIIASVVSQKKIRSYKLGQSTHDSGAQAGEARQATDKSSGAKKEVRVRVGA